MSTTGSFTPHLPGAAVVFNLGGVVYTASLPATPSSDVWLTGPLVVEGRYVVTPVKADGTAHPFLRVLFDVRCYSDGTSRLDVTADNTLDK